MKVAKWIGLNLLLVLLTLGAAEILLRAFGAYGPSRYHVRNPNTSIRDRQTEWDLRYQINDLGLRGPLRSFEPEPGVERVVAIGDSFAFGQGVEEEEAFPSVLERLLRRRGLPVDVINVSSIGVGPEAYYVLLKEIGLRYRPRFVVLNAFGNDASESAWPPLSRRIVRRLSHYSHLFVLPRMLNQLMASRRMQETTARSGDFWKRLHGACSKFQSEDRCTESIEAFRARFGSEVNNLASVCLSDPEEVWRWANTDPALPGWRLLEVYVDRMQALCRQHGCRLVLAGIPDGVQVDPAQRDVRELLGVHYDDSVLTGAGAFQTGLQELAAELEIGWIDPLERFREVRDGLYYPADLHWTAEGHRLYASVLAEHLAKAWR